MIKCPNKMTNTQETSRFFSIPLIAWLNLSHAWKSQREEPMPGWRFTARKNTGKSYYWLDIHSYGSHKRKQLLEQWNVWKHDARRQRQCVTFQRPRGLRSANLCRCCCYIFNNPSDLPMICQICVSLRLNWVSCSHWDKPAEKTRAEIFIFIFFF